jgi:uncharacterized membrane protein
MANRNQTIDLLKGIAVLLMIQVHILELFASPAIYYSNIGRILLFLGGPPVAPVFMLLMGYFTMRSKKTSKQLIVRGLIFFSSGMLLNILLNLNLVISVNKNLLKLEIAPYIFGVDILQFAGLSTIIIALLKKTFEKSRMLLVTCIITFAFLGHYLLNYIPQNMLLKYFAAFFFGTSFWSYFPLFPWLAYPLTGMAFYQLKKYLNPDHFQKSKTKLLVGILFLLFLTLTIKYAISVAADLTSYYHHGFVFFLWVVIFAFFYGFFTFQLNAFTSKVLNYIRWLGENVTAIYIVQWIIIGNVATTIYQSVSNPFYLGTWFLAVVLVSSAIVYVLLQNFKITRIP